MNLFKPKTKEEFLEEIKGTYVNSIIQSNYLAFFKEEIPLEYLPLKTQIIRLLHQNYPQYTGDNLNDPHIYLKRYRISIFPNFRNENKGIFLDMTPVRRIPELENIRKGTVFHITSYEQVETIIKFLETH